MRALGLAIAIGALSGCSAILGIGDLPSRFVPDGGPPDGSSPDGGALDSGLPDSAIPKGDGPTCTFDDPGSQFDRTCTFDF